MATKIDYEADAAALGISVERYKKARRSLLTTMARRKSNVGTPTKYTTIDGPWPDAELFLHGQETAVISVGGNRGRYVLAKPESRYHYQRRGADLQLTWETIQ